MANRWILFFAFLCGVVSSLFVSTPFGHVAMFDMIAYFLGPIMFLYCYRRFSRSERCLLTFSFFWFLWTCYSNWWRGENLQTAMKGDAIVFNVMCMLVTCIFLLKKSYKAFFWFVVGAGISNVISLYVFQNGALLYFADRGGFEGTGGIQDYLLEKQVYPIYANAVFVSVLFPLRVLMHIPWFTVVVGCVASAFTLLFKGGSRSSFGIFLVTAAFAACYAYFRGLIRAGMKNMTFFIIAGLLLCYVVFSVYSHLASSGALGEGEYGKYMEQMVDSERGFLGDRDDLFRAWPFLKDHPVVGAGSSALDRWGYMEEAFFLPGHSALVGAWVQNGIAGLIFWLYALYLMFEFMRKRMLFFANWFPFLVYQWVILVWAILFSPFGGQRGLTCMALALCVITQSKKYMDEVQFDLTR